MFCSFLDIRLEKTIKPMFLLSALLFVLGVQVCFGQIVKKRGGPQVINKDLVVTKTLSVGLSPNALHYGSGAKLIVGGMTGSGALTIGPWPASPTNSVFFGVSTLSQSESKNYALIQSFAGSAKGRTFLNSPVDIRFRINNKDKMILSNNGKLLLKYGIESMDKGFSRLSIYGESEGNVNLVKGGGNVGIGGLAKKNTKLAVWGLSYFSSRITCDQFVLAAGFTETSDAKLKTNIVPLANALEKLEQIRGVSFEWNEKSKSKGYAVGQKNIGVIAQEVEAVFPEVVFTSEDDGYKAVDYGRLTSVLIEAVKELKAMNEVLERRVEALEKATGK